MKVTVLNASKEVSWSVGDMFIFNDDSQRRVFVVIVIDNAYSILDLTSMRITYVNPADNYFRYGSITDLMENVINNLGTVTRVTSVKLEHI
jgi:hypothetical protein